MVPAEESTSANNFVKVRRAALLSCLTCPLCTNLLRDATTISVCLHTFCKDCIHQKLEEDETCCPVCNIYLGSLPKEKLRSDNSLQELRMKIFPLRKLKETDIAASVGVNHSKRKERSLSSLVINRSPKSKKRSIARTRSSTKKTGMLNSRKVIADKDIAEESSKIKQEQAIQSPKADHDDSVTKPENDFSWEKLTFLAEAAQRTEEFSLGFRENAEERQTSRAKNMNKLKRKTRKTASQDVDNKASLQCSVMEEYKSDHYGNGNFELQLNKKHIAQEATALGVLDSSLQKLNPVWFALIASKDHCGDTVPHIPNCYIRIKDGRMPTSYINKYLMQKLKLKEESEVEVRCCGQLLVPTATLTSIIDIWIQHKARTSKATLFSSTSIREDIMSNNVSAFLIVLTYSMKKPIT